MKMEIDYPAIGRRIQLARKRRGLTQEQLAAQLSVGVQHISHIENGRTAPSMDVFLHISIILEATPNELLCGELPSAPLEEAANHDLMEIIRGCTARERRVAADLLRTLIESLRRQTP